MTLAIHDAIAVAALICVLGIFTSLVRGPQVPAAAGATSGAAGGRPWAGHPGPSPTFTRDGHPPSVSGAAGERQP